MTHHPRIGCQLAGEELDECRLARAVGADEPEDLSSVVLLESSKGAELHLRSEEGTLLRVPLGDADHLKGLAALAMMAGALGSLAAKPA